MQSTVTAPASVAASDDRPVLFLHIPKTAGTSFLSTLRNLFGDSRVRRIETVDENTKGMLDALIARDLASISCLTGHLPLWMFEGKLDRFRPFTILRDPVERVLSLYRFLKSGDPRTLRRLGLNSDVSLAQFLGCRHPEVYAQVRNGMTRMLCGDPAMLDFDKAAFWDEDEEAAALQRAYERLQGLDFGFVERMKETLQTVGVAWGAPFALRPVRENVTHASEEEAQLGDLRAIVQMNACDFALYRRAQALSIAREAARSAPRLDHFRAFSPLPGVETCIAEVPCRQGFYEFEADGFAWVRDGAPAEIHFAFPTRKASLRMLVYTLSNDYPVQDVELRVNGTRLKTECLESEPHWVWLESAPFAVLRGANRLEIEAPLFLPATSVTPGSTDSRRLSVAVATATFLDNSP